MPDLVNLTIDDKKVSVPKGTLIVEAAKSVGITIPVFCYHEKMKPIGACRMCLVEVGTPRRNPDGTMATNPDGTPVIAFMPKPQTACTTPVSEGMVVRTHSPAVIKAQKGILEFLLINHPLDCPVCDKGGECPLQDQTYMFGPGESRFVPSDKLHFAKPIDLSERIALDRERCIMCFRCVRFQEEIAGDPQIDVFQRGARSEIAVVPGQKWDSNFSGNAIELCPVGALTSKEFRFRARAWEVHNTHSICPLCAVGCNLKLQVRSNQVLRILAADNEDVNEVWICDRGRFDYEYLNEGRLLKPKVRRDASLREVTWETAQKSIAERIRQVIGAYGPGAVGGIASPRLTNEDLYVFQKFMRAVVGTNNVDYRLDGLTVAARPMQMAISGLEQAKSILLIGTDIFEELPILGLRVRKAAVHGQTKLVVAHPRPVKLHREAAAWVRYADGTELALLGCLIRAARGEPVGDLCAAAGLSPQQAQEATKLLAGQSPAILYPARLVEGARGAETLAALESLAAALGGTLHGLVIEANAQGARNMGVTPHLLPGGRPVSDAAARKELADLWGMAALPDSPGLCGRDMLEAATAGKLRILYVAGADVLKTAADQDLVQKALTSVDMLIVQDLTEPQLTSMADVVLPGFSFAECEGTYTNVERRVQRLRQALRPVGDMRPDWQIIAGIAAALAGAEWGYRVAEDVFGEITRAVPAYCGLTYAKLGYSGVRV